MDSANHIKHLRVLPQVLLALAAGALTACAPAVRPDAAPSDAAHRVHTTVIFVSRTSGTPDFEAFRDGDYKLTPDEVLAETIAQARVVHASTWPLLREPARQAVNKAFRLAHEQGKIISLDPYYSPQIWPDHREAAEVYRQMFRYTTITKASKKKISYMSKIETP